MLGARGFIRTAIKAIDRQREGKSGRGSEESNSDNTMGRVKRIRAHVAEEGASSAALLGWGAVHSKNLQPDCLISSRRQGRGGEWEVWVSITPIPLRHELSSQMGVALQAA